MFIFLKNIGHQEHEKSVRSEWTSGDNCKNLVKQWLYGHRNRNILMKNLYHLCFSFHLVLSSSFFSAIPSYMFKGRVPTSEIGRTGIFLLVSRSFLTLFFFFPSQHEICGHAANCLQPGSPSIHLLCWKHWNIDLHSYYLFWFRFWPHQSPHKMHWQSFSDNKFVATISHLPPNWILIFWSFQHTELLQPSRLQHRSFVFIFPCTDFSREWQSNFCFEPSFYYPKLISWVVNHWTDTLWCWLTGQGKRRGWRHVDHLPLPSAIQ